jgi:transcriptional regulator with XRE-family HTH domain
MTGEEAESIGERITRLRQRKAWSQRELAKQAHIDVATVSRLESGTRASLGLDAARKIAKALDVDLNYLANFYGSGGE